MSRFRFDLLVFVAGLAVVGWIGIDYLGSNPLASAVSLLIGACYVGGGVELWRYRQATGTLTHALGGLSAPPARLDAWLAVLHPSLRNAVRLRIEGIRIALPGPALTPYLVGLLVLLGMLGTLLGMTETLRGTGAALGSASDLAAIHAALAAPLAGLGFAFGTSIAGVASSAALGLVSALYRRERMHAADQLDAQIATTLRAFSPAQRKDENFALMQRQTELMPVLVDRLQTLMGALEHQNQTLHARQAADQQAFHQRMETAQARLADSLGQMLRLSASEAAQAAGEALRPVMAHTAAELARENAAMRGTVTQAVREQIEALARHFSTSTADVAGVWRDTAVQQRQTNETLVRDLQGALQRFGDTFGQQSGALVDSLGARLDQTTTQLSSGWHDALARQEATHATLATQHQQALENASNGLGQRAVALVQTVERALTGLQDGLAARDEQRLAQWSAALKSVNATLTERWEQIAEQDEQRRAHWAAALNATSTALTDQWQRTAAQHEQHLTSATATLTQGWEQTAARAAERHQAICDALAGTADDIAARSQAHASATIAEISQLVQAAAQAPKLAADVVTEMREKLADSLARDTATLEERSRLLATLATLLDAVNHASTEQRVAIDALVTNSSDLLERVGRGFAERIDSEAGRLDGAAAQLTGSAVEIASLGDVFAGAVQLFGASNQKLVEGLQRIETALDKSATRSDEQLAYYVAQARELVDLSVLSQKQMLAELRHVGQQQALAGAESA